MPTTSLIPVTNNEEYAVVADAMRSVINDVYNETLKAGIDELLQYGAPWVSQDASFIIRFLSLAGVDATNPLNGKPNEAALILKAWLSKKHKRSYRFLEYYLQMLYPDAFEIKQQWHPKDSEYPTALTTEQDNNCYLTSRLAVIIHTKINKNTNLASYLYTLQSIVPARFVLDIEYFMPINLNLNAKMAGLISPSTIVDLSGSFIGELDLGVQNLSLGGTVHANGVFVDLSGDIVNQVDVICKSTAEINAEMTTIIELSGEIK